MRRRRFLILAGVLLAGPGIAPGADPTRGAAGPAAAETARHAQLMGISEQELLVLRQSCREAGFTEEEFSRLSSLIQRARLAGLPHEQLLDKLDEGLAKQAMPDKVLRALERRGRHLSDAKEIVNQLIMQGWSAPNYDLAVALVADALGAGQSSSEVVRGVRAGAPSAGTAPDVARAFVAPLKPPQ